MTRCRTQRPPRAGRRAVPGRGRRAPSRATSSQPRMLVSGVRSSWAMSLTIALRCASRRSRRSVRSLKAAARMPVSSRVVTGTRTCRSGGCWAACGQRAQRAYEPGGDQRGHRDGDGEDESGDADDLGLVGRGHVEAGRRAGVPACPGRVRRPGRRTGRAGRGGRRRRRPAPSAPVRRPGRRALADRYGDREWRPAGGARAPSASGVSGSQARAGQAGRREPAWSASSAFCSVGIGVLRTPVGAGVGHIAGVDGRRPRPSRTGRPLGRARRWSSRCRTGRSSALALAAQLASSSAALARGQPVRARPPAGRCRRAGRRVRV